MTKREGSFTLTKYEAQKIVERLEYDASYDKVGEIYYKLKNWLKEVATPAQKK